MPCISIKRKRKVLLRRDHEGSQLEMYSCTLSLTLHQMRVGGQCHTPDTLRLGKRPGTHCIGGWVGPRAGLGKWKILLPLGFDP
jgi:hypothetical protein